MKKIDLQSTRVGEAPDPQEAESLNELAQLIQSQLEKGILFYALLVKPNEAGFIVRQLSNFDDPPTVAYLLSRCIDTELNGTGRVHTEYHTQRRSDN